MAEETLRETLSRVIPEESAEPVVEVKAEPIAEVKAEPIAEVKAEPVADEKVKPAVIDEKVKPAVIDEKVKPVIEDKPKGIRAPESWKPALREQHWAKLPVAVQAEIHRRERQIDDALQHSSEARKGMEQFSQLVNQYKDVFEFEKAAPMQSINNLLNISKTLRFAPQPQKAQMMATVIQGFGVDLKLLDQALSLLVTSSDPESQAARSQDARIEQALQKHLAPVRELLTGFQTNQQAARQAADNTIKSEIETFANDPANEYFEVVRDAMADILEAGASRGQKITLQDAYKRAILANNDLAGQFSQQSLAQAAQKLNAPAAQALQRARMSVTGSPSAGAAPAVGNSVRSAIEAAVAQHSGRG